MNRLLLKVAMTAAGGSLLLFSATFSQMPPSSQIPPPAKKAAHVRIIQGPTLEFARQDLAILRWTTNNPGGTDDHFAVAHFGTNPKELNRTAKNHIRLNRGHMETMFRVRLDDLSPQTTYYYSVTSTESNGKSDGVVSPIKHFTTPGPGQRIEAYPQPVSRSN